MLKFNFKGEIDEITRGLKHLSNRMHFELSESGISVSVSKCDKGFRVTGDAKSAEISYERKRDFFRAVGFLLARVKAGKPFDVSQTPNFDVLTLFVDGSRNGALTVDSIKKLLDYAAVMGFDSFNIYSEDMIELENYPYFGHMHGRYSINELKECDDYAYDYGIEIIADAQSLGHMENVLKWYGCKIPSDTYKILLVDDDKTYEFLDEVIGTWSKTLRSRKINLHMDEAHGIGSGKYKKLHGLEEPLDIIFKHMRKVNKILEKYGYEESYISHDMLVKAFSKNNDVYDINVKFSDEFFEKIPANYTINYWDYHNPNPQDYGKMIDIISKFPNKMRFSGGIMTWNKMVPNYRLIFKCMPGALKTCIEKGVRNVQACMFGDNGSETNHFSGLLGMQLFAEYCYAETTEVSMETLRERFFECTGGNMDDFIEIGRLDCVSEDSTPLLSDSPVGASNLSKWAFYNDPLIGLMDKHLEDCPVNDYYKKLVPRLEVALKRAGEWEFIFEMPLKLAKVLTLKADLGVEITKAYKNGDKKELKRICDVVIPEIKVLVDDFRKAHRRQWMKTYKPFGWEVLDCRYGGVIARLDSTIYRIEEYLNGKVESLPELMEERLYYDGMDRPKEHQVGAVKSYARIVTGGYLS